VRPLRDGFFAVEPHQIYIMPARRTREYARHLEQKTCGGAAIIRADEIRAGHGFGVVVASEDDGLAGSALEPRDDVLHRSLAQRRVGSEIVGNDFAAERLE